MRSFFAMAFYISFLAAANAGVEFENCKQEQVAESSIGEEDFVLVRATACAITDQKYNVAVALFVKGKILQSTAIDAEGLSYVPLVESLDLDGDGKLDIGVANGKGRAGDGMNYWLLRFSPLRLLPIGGAPNLSWSNGGK